MDSRISSAYAAFSRADQEGGYRAGTGASASSLGGGALAWHLVRWNRFKPNTAARIIPAGNKNVIFKYVLILLFAVV
jgi:hypothetical protein